MHTAVLFGGMKIMYEHRVNYACVLVSCSYPYEYDGGHIRGAKNIYTKEQIFKEFVDIKQPKQNPGSGEAERGNETLLDGKRNILIFHCEFSSERGPNL
jgi:M-phase inducer phosphatase